MTASDAFPATILLTGRGPDLTRAAEALGALRGAEIVPVQPEALLAGLDARDVDVLVLAGGEALDLCRQARARVARLTLPILVLGAEVAEALAAGANDGLAGAWAGDELAARARSLVSTRRCVVEALAQARAEARGEAARLEDELLANMSHELRTPLTAIVGWARMLRTHTLPEEKRARGLEMIERNSLVQAKLIEDLLDASHIVARSLEIEIARVDVALVVETVIAALRPDCEAKRVALRSTIDPSVGLVCADEHRLRQVMEKLLSNAIKFTPPSGSITVRVEPERAPEGVRITVADTGAGIPAAFLPHVFDRFRQADCGTTRAHGGLGLGLCIARHLAELHGGTIEAHSEGEGRGATFVVRLPAGGAEPAAPALD